MLRVNCITLPTGQLPQVAFGVRVQHGVEGYRGCENLSAGEADVVLAKSRGIEGWASAVSEAKPSTMDPAYTGHHTVVNCPRAMVGRVIGKGGETIKALQQYTGASLQIDQSFEPTAVTISGTPSAVSLAQAMVQDIVNGSFKGFAMLRQMVLHASQEGGPEAQGPLPVYIEGYGFVPPTQFYSPEELATAKLQGMVGLSGMPRTPPSTAQRGMNIPLGALPSTPPYESVLAGSPDFSQLMSNLRLGDTGAAGIGAMGASVPQQQEFWTAEHERERSRAAALGGEGLEGFGGLDTGAGGGALGGLPGLCTEGLGVLSSGFAGGGGGGLGGGREGLLGGPLPGGLALGGTSGLTVGLASSASASQLSAVGLGGGSQTGGLGLSQPPGLASVQLGRGGSAPGVLVPGEGLLSGEPLMRTASSGGARSGLTPLASSPRRSASPEPPESPQSQPASGLPPGWKLVRDPDGRGFYLNTCTGKSQWEVPES